MVYTTGEIAKMLNVPLHKVVYLIRAKNIQPAQRVAHFRLFDQAAVDAIRAELS